MKKTIFLFFVLMLGILFISARLWHETLITVISPKANMSYKKGQIVDIHFKVKCGEKLKSLNYDITDQDNKVLFSKQPNVKDKHTYEEKSSITITQTDPSVLTLNIEAKDADGHGSSKTIQVNVNF